METKNKKLQARREKIQKKRNNTMQFAELMFLFLKQLTYIFSLK
jgi:dihydroorotase